MKLTIKTSKLKDMVSRAVKGCSNNKVLPITSLMAIELKDGKLTFITTDATNYLYVTEDKFDSGEFYVVVQADVFAKLVGKTTCETVVLEVMQDDTLKFKGNGTYKIELPLDENGYAIRFPDPVSKSAFNTVSSNTTINLSTIKTILQVNKAALATSLDVPCYTGYYCGDLVVTTDTSKICGLGIKLFDNPVLISPEMMNLFSVCLDEKIDVRIIDNEMLFTCPSCTIYGKTLPGIEDFAIVPITGLLNQGFESVCKLPKGALLQVLDRMSLFIGLYDKNSVTLTFTSEGLVVSSKRSNNSELIVYQESDNFKDYTCDIDVTMLMSQIKAQTSEVVEMWYGADNAIKMVNGNITQIVALTEEE